MCVLCSADLDGGKAPSLREAVALGQPFLWANACFSSAAYRKSDLTEGTWAVVLVSNIFFSFTDPLASIGSQPWGTKTICFLSRSQNSLAEGERPLARHQDTEWKQELVVSRPSDFGLSRT